VIISKRVVAVAFSLILSLWLFNAPAVLAQNERQQGGGRQQQQAARVQLPPAEATVTLNEQFLNSLLDAVFTNLRPPSFPLSLAKTETENAPAVTLAADSLAPTRKINQCTSQIVLEREMSGVRTAVRFEKGRITAPLAFTGTYNTGLLGCLRFQGWADTVINLEFSRERQTLNAKVDVIDIHLNGIPQLANGVVVQMVQNAIDQRINPIEILQAAQLTTRLPISAAGGALRLRAKELRPEIIPGAIRLHIIYEFVRAD
jgi:hypothetical protein